MKHDQRNQRGVRCQSLSSNLLEKLFPPHLEVVPQLNEVYELQLALWESEVLSDEEIVRNGAYFSRVADQLTRHFLICRGEPVRIPQHSSSRLRSFFKTNQFKTGYATHGLFPYRGKFHPQMIKALLNIMGLKPGHTVLDPMMGSGTVLIEATLMGINSVGIDASPFCRFMTQAKLDGLTVPLSPIRRAQENPRAVFNEFCAHLAKVHSCLRKKNQDQSQADLFSQVDNLNAVQPVDYSSQGIENTEVHNFLLLSFLDAVGYTERSGRKGLYDNFVAILERYLFVAEKIQHVLSGAENELGHAEAFEGDARKLPQEDGSIDAVIFSPPYSFAIDYLINDEPHLKYLGIDVGSLRDSAMIGLRGRNLREQYELYKQDMTDVLRECARVLKPDGLCTIVVGTNNDQLSRILGVKPSQVKGIDEILVEIAAEVGLCLSTRIERQITGMANTMRTEYIVILKRT